MNKLFKISYQKGWAYLDPDEISYIRYYPGLMYSKDAGEGVMCFHLKHDKCLEVYDVSEKSADKYIKRFKESKGLVDNPLEEVYNETNIE